MFPAHIFDAEKLAHDTMQFFVEKPSWWIKRPAVFAFPHKKDIEAKMNVLVKSSQENKSNFASTRNQINKILGCSSRYKISSGRMLQIIQEDDMISLYNLMVKHTDSTLRRESNGQRNPMDNRALFHLALIIEQNMTLLMERIGAWLII